MVNCLVLGALARLKLRLFVLLLVLLLKLVVLVFRRLHRLLSDLLYFDFASLSL